MKVIILAGGRGTRISNNSKSIPKPLVDIAGRPIIWHVMKIYSYFGLTDFIIACGYKSDLIKKYFKNYNSKFSDIEISLKKSKNLLNQKKKVEKEKWNISLINTGIRTLTGGRLIKLKKHLKGEKHFCLTYCDGVANINIKKLIKFHIQNQSMCTLSAVQPMGRFGILNIDNKKKLVKKFVEKPKGDGSWVNGGFFVFDSQIFNFCKKLKKKINNIVLETDILKKIAIKKKLSVFKHHSFWFAMDTQRDRNFLENLHKSKKAYWQIWKKKSIK